MLGELAYLSPDKVYELLETQPRGLRTEEAARRLETFGPNVLQETKGQPLIVKFLLNFAHLMAVLLWVAGIIALVGKMPELAIAIWMVNVINGCFSFWQEFRAGKATEALQKLLPSYARVLRDGKETRILASELVPGDIMLLEEGDAISVDARLIATNDMRTNQSTLTGESRPVRKTIDATGVKTVAEESEVEDVALTQQPNIVFAGTTVFSGTGTAVVYATGMSTEFGKIAGLTQSTKEELSPLQKEMNGLTRSVSVFAIGVGAMLFLLAVFFVNAAYADAFIFAIGMTVAFIPEGLLPTVTLSLALSVQRMAKRHALVKRLSSIETLGSTTVICTDKTGTLTQNEMTVSSVWIQGHDIEVSGVGYDAHKGDIDLSDGVDQQNLTELLRASALCCNARLVPPNAEHSNISVLGDPTEAALLVMAEKGGSGRSLESLWEAYPRLRELPFDSDRKRMTTINREPDGSLVASIKGAPREIIELCTSRMLNGVSVPFSDEERNHAMTANDMYAYRGLRVLAIAQRNLDTVKGLPSTFSEYSSELIEQDLCFLGLVAMVDPPRERVAEAVEKCHRAGIRIIMMTGDYGLTAESIARKIGVIQGDSARVISGAELAAMSDNDLKEALCGEVIFARVAPEQKLQVVTCLQEMGEIVAVTGDGVNDSPALKKADIGVAMGLSGTDVAKEAADIILTDDNFASIVGAVEEGRSVYSNIRKFALYIFNTNAAAAVPMIIYLFSRGNVPLALGVMLVLAIDLGTDMLPAMGLGAEEPEPGIMNQKPRSHKEHVFNHQMLLKAFGWYGAIGAIFGMLGFFFVQWRNGWPLQALQLAGIQLEDGTILRHLVYEQAMMMTFACIVFTQIGAVLGIRSTTRSVFTMPLLRNRLIVMGIAMEVALVAAISYVPFLQNLFGTAGLQAEDWLILFMIPVAVVLLDEVRKAILRSWMARRRRREVAASSHRMPAAKASS